MLRVGAARAAGTRRAGFGCGTAIVVAVLVFLCVSLLSAAVFAISSERGAGASTPFIPRQPGAIPWDGRSRLNILLLGSTPASRSGVMIVLSYEPAARSLSILSLPDNLWVTIPGAGQDRLSHAYDAGGGRMALLVAQSVLHVQIPYYAFLPSHAFAQLIDFLGGVSLQSSSQSGVVQAATAHRNGDQALSYIEPVDTSEASEIDSMSRARRLLVAAMQSARQPSIVFQIPTIVTTLGGSIPTNFPYDQVPALVRTVLAVPASHIHMDQLSERNNAVSGYRGDSGFVLLPDWQHIRLLAQRDLGDPGTNDASPVEVLNGAGVDGAASSLALWLRQAHVRVSSYSTAASASSPRTQVLLSTRARTSDARSADAVSTLLQIPIVRTKAYGGAAVRVLIGRDFQDPTQQ